MWKYVPELFLNTPTVAEYYMRIFPAHVFKGKAHGEGDRRQANIQIIIASKDV